MINFTVERMVGYGASASPYPPYERRSESLTKFLAHFFAVGTLDDSLRIAPDASICIAAVINFTAERTVGYGASASPYPPYERRSESPRVRIVVASEFLFFLSEESECRVIPSILQRSKSRH